MLAEDALQDALVNALERWKVDGVPASPGLAVDRCPAPRHRPRSETNLPNSRLYTIIRRILNVNGDITDVDPKGDLQGPVNQWVDDLADIIIDCSFDTFIPWAEGEVQLSRVAEVGVPEVREEVATECN